jgi:hypothetical protein
MKERGSFVKKSAPLIALALSLTACSDGPRREKFPGPQGMTTDGLRAQSAREVMGGSDSFAQRMEQRANAQNEVGGQVLLAEKQKLPAKYFLFVYARRLSGGPPLAVKREKQPQLPYSFKITQDNVMIPGTVLEGLVDVSAKIDQDGDPLSVQDGDLNGTVQAKVGQKDLVITVQ